MLKLRRLVKIVNIILRLIRMSLVRKNWIEWLYCLSWSEEIRSRLVSVLICRVSFRVIKVIEIRFERVYLLGSVV